MLLLIVPLISLGRVCVFIRMCSSRLAAHPSVHRRTMVSSMRMSCGLGRLSLAPAPSARAQRPRPSTARRHVTMAKYGDESIYFDLEDVEQTTGQWEMYAKDGETR